MKRRTFLKIVGMAVAMPGAMFKAGASRLSSALPKLPKFRRYSEEGKAAIGTYTGTGSDITVDLGVVPSYVRVVQYGEGNITSLQERQIDETLKTMMAGDHGR
ncbi:hypothetical protein LCGC14_0384410 [marine sediment metagenome]|uniref:Uncharacterized protein n=1 Tax=marine sediment metagenome TaxID=412755 RepID=A0A0F9TJI4_9ZZZZ